MRSASPVGDAALRPSGPNAGLEIIGACGRLGVAPVFNRRNVFRFTFCARCVERYGVSPLDTISERFAT